jgi:hypothetical protein
MPATPLAIPGLSPALPKRTSPHYAGTLPFRM